MCHFLRKPRIQLNLSEDNRRKSYGVDRCKSLSKDFTNLACSILRLCCRSMRCCKDLWSARIHCIDTWNFFRRLCWHNLCSFWTHTQQIRVRPWNIEFKSFLILNLIILEVWGFGFRVLGFGFWVWNLGFGVWGLLGRYSALLMTPSFLQHESNLARKTQNHKP